MPSDPPLQPPSRRHKPFSGHDVQDWHLSRFPFQATVDHLKKAIAAKDLILIHEIDTQSLMARGGFTTLPIRQLLFFHPRYMVRLLEADPGALLQAPLKLVVRELPDGRVAVRHADVREAFGRYPGLGPLGEELQRICQGLAGVVSGLAESQPQEPS